MKLLHFVIALFLFVLAIQLMKAGARALAPNLRGTFPVDNAVSTLGLWPRSRYRSSPPPR
jgi:hypothetical protein